MFSKEVILHSFLFFGASILIGWLQIRTYGLLIIIGLALFIYKTRCPCIKIIMPETLIIRFHSIYNSFTKLRKDKPGAFCTIMSFILIVFAILGHIISGTWIVIFSLIITGIISTRHQFKFVKEPSDDKSWSDHENDEFLPDVDESMLTVLKRAGEEAVLTYPYHNLNDNDEDNKSEPEIPLDLIIPDNLPEVDDNSSISDNDELNINSVNNLIQFNVKHFKDKDSSSSSDDDDSITRGLNFQDLNIKIDNGNKSVTTISKSYQQPTPSSNTTTNMFKNMTGCLGLVTNLLKTAVEEQQQQHQQQIIENNKRRTRRQNIQDALDDEYVFVNSDDLNS